MGIKDNAAKTDVIKQRVRILDDQIIEYPTQPWDNCSNKIVIIV